MASKSPRKGGEPSSPEEPGSLIRLQRVLAMAGVDSRRHSEEFILAGRVTVDGKTVTALGARVDPDRHDIRLDGERLAQERKVYYALNKPIGFLCTHADPDGRTRVTDLFPNKRERLFTVGRLDENSQGLLLLTNDGILAHRLAHPSFSVPKQYRVHVAGTPSREILEQLRTGVHFAEGKFRVQGVKQLRVRGKSAILEITLTEGQNREIRRLLAKLGHKVLCLERVSLGPLKLGTLPLGAHRPLTSTEVTQLKKFAAGTPEKAAHRKSPRKLAAGLRSGGATKPSGAPKSAAAAARGPRRKTTTRGGR